MNHLEEIREKMAPMTSAERLRIALKAEVSPRTIENILGEKKDVYYSTVIRIHEALKESKPKAAKKTAKK